MPTAAQSQQPVLDAIGDLPEHLDRDYDLLGLLKEEVDKSGELYLKVALWKVLLRICQHGEDLLEPNNPAGREAAKQMLVKMMGHSESLMAEGALEGGLDQKKHGTTERIVRENIQWMREKLVLLEASLTESRKDFILKAFSGGTA
jgi:hypothetical protein